MNDILPPKRPLSPPPTPPVRPPAQPAPSAEQKRLEASEPPLLLEEHNPEPRRHKKLVWGIIGIILALLVSAIVGAVGWYQLSLRAVAPGEKGRERVEIASGMSPRDIGGLLKENNLIRSQLAFDIYTRLSGTRGQLQAGVYSLSPSESMEDIVKHIVSGKTDQFSITFLPGATLAENRQALIKAGYSESEVDAALGKQYSHHLFATKPRSANLEGYIYGETYTFDSSATVEQVLEKTFDTFYEVVQEEKLAAAFKRQKLTLYQGITLASIIQREVPDAKDQKQVAQIFLKRYREGMPLGSDVTAYYGADLKGVERAVTVDTPYNTRMHKGLPPGPIGTPGATALQAVAHPAKGDYVYFLSGDDDVTYYARTSAEHEANIRDHCQIKCAMK